MILSHKEALNPQGYDYITDSETGEIFAVERATGAVIEAVTDTHPVGTIFYTPEQQQAYRERKKREKDRKLYRSDKPKFYFASAESDCADIRPETSARLFYLAAHMGYEGGVLMLSQKAPMKYSDLQAVLGLSTTATWNFWNETSGKYIFRDKNGVLYMPDALFHRGKFSADRRYQQVFIDSVKTLYRQTPPTKHRYLGYVFKLIPFINLEYNVLCHDIFETDFDKIQRLTFKEFCDVIGYNFEQRKRLMKTYRDNITFNLQGKTQRFLSVISDAVDFEEATFYVNPNVIYHGHIPDKVWILGEFCKIHED